MPPLAEAEYEALKVSIAAGYDPAHPVVVDENGVVLDGHHRQQVCAELGITAPVVILPGLTEDQKHDYAVRANLACRHLTQLQKRELIRAELERDPGRSDREIGRLCGADHKTVASVRRGGEIPHVRQDEDTHTALVRHVAELLDLHDKLEAEQARAREVAARWRELWTRCTDSLLALPKVWDPVLAEHTGYASCLEWLQHGDGDAAEGWRRLTENVGTLQDFAAAAGFDARWFGVDDEPLGPSVAEVEKLLSGEP